MIKLMVRVKKFKNLGKLTLEWNTTTLFQWKYSKVSECNKGRNWFHKCNFL